MVLASGGEAGDFEDGDFVTLRVVNIATSATLLEAGGVSDFDELSPKGSRGPTCDFATVELGGA